MAASIFDQFHAEAGDILSGIFANTRDCIKLLSLDGKLEYVSASAQDALGFTDTAAVIGKSWLAHWPPGERDVVEAARAQAAAGQAARFHAHTSTDTGIVRRWDVAISPIRDAGGTITHLIAISTDVTPWMDAKKTDVERRERAEHDASAAMTMAGELRHRLKNQLAVVAAVAKLLARHTSDARDLARKLEEKLIALARAQDLLTINRAAPIDARDAVTQVVGASGAGDRVAIGDIPVVPLPDESIQQIALILGELQTNALKHGALRDDRGQVFLSGQPGDGVLTLRWEEDCGRPIDPVDTGHGGFQLIRRLGVTGRQGSTIDWHPRGIVVEFHVRTDNGHAGQRDSV